MRFLRSPRVRRTALLLVLWGVILGILFAIREVLLPVFIAVFLAYVIDPVVGRLTRVEVRGRRLPRWSAVLTLYGAAAIALWLSAVFVVPQLFGEVERLWRTTAGWLQQVDEAEIQKAAARLDELAAQLSLPIRVVASDDEAASVPGLEPGELGVPDEPGEPSPSSAVPHREGQRPVGLDGGSGRLGTQPVEDAGDRAPLPFDDDFALDGDETRSFVYTLNLKKELRAVLAGAAHVLQDQTGVIASRLQALVGGLVGFVFKFFLVLMITAFLAVDTDRIKRFFFSLLPLEDRDAYDGLLARIDRGLSGVVRGQLTICFVNGVLTLIGLLLLDVKFAFLLATVAAVFSLVPIFGSIISTIPIVIVALATDGIGTAVLALAWIIIIHAVEANLLNPKIMGDAARIHPVVVVIALITGEHFYGIPGALFAVPVTSIGITLFKSLQARAERLEGLRSPPLTRSPKPRPRSPRAHREPIA